MVLGGHLREKHLNQVYPDTLVSRGERSRGVL